MKIKVSDSIGSVSAEISKAKDPKDILVLAHGAGAGMHHPFMKSLSDELNKLSVTVIRFNFPFTENKKGRPDVPAVAHATIEAVINAASKKFPSLHIFASGKSFGGRMTSQLMAAKDLTEVKGIIFFGFPLHQPGNPSLERAEHLKKVKVPMLFLQGTRDALADYKLIQKIAKPIKNSTLKVFEGADHSFKSGKLNLIPTLAQDAATWMLNVSL